MAKHRRYQLTERQLAPVIRYINENYPAGVTGHEDYFNRDSYGQVRDVTLKPNGSLVLDIVTDNGQPVEKEVWLGENEVVATIESHLPPEAQGIEWEVTNAEMRGDQVSFDVDANGNMFNVMLNTDEVINWLPELSSDDLPDNEPDPDLAHDRAKEDF
jgi:hypothetical protein